MKPWLFLALLVVARSATSQNRKLEKATRTQIMEVLPTSLKTIDRPDPAGEARYARLLQLAKETHDPIVSKGLASDADSATRSAAVARARPLLTKAERTLDGTLRMPFRSDPIDGFPKAASLKGLSKLVALAATEMAARGDRIACARYATLGLRLADRLVRAGGGTMDLIVATTTEAIAERAAVEAGAKGGLSAEGRARVLARLPTLKGPMPEGAAALRREFVGTRMPVLLDPIHGWERVFGSSMAFAGAKNNSTVVPGNYDPIATAKIIGKMFDAAIADSQRPLDRQSGLATRIAEEAERTVPDDHGLSRAEFAKRMNALPNSLGLIVVSAGTFDGMARLGTRRATYRNLARATILLQSGRSASVPDPFGHGPLKIDPKRRIVWSVGENGKDDGGDIGKGRGAKAPDLGYRY